MNCHHKDRQTSTIHGPISGPCSTSMFSSWSGLSLKSRILPHALVWKARLFGTCFHRRSVDPEVVRPAQGPRFGSITDLTSAGAVGHWEESRRKVRSCEWQFEREPRASERSVGFSNAAPTSSTHWGPASASIAEHRPRARAPATPEHTAPARYTDSRFSRNLLRGDAVLRETSTSLCRRLLRDPGYVSVRRARAQSIASTLPGRRGLSCIRAWASTSGSVLVGSVDPGGSRLLL